MRKHGVSAVGDICSFPLHTTYSKPLQTYAMQARSVENTGLLFDREMTACKTGNGVLGVPIPSEKIIFPLLRASTFDKLPAEAMMVVTSELDDGLAASPVEYVSWTFAGSISSCAFSLP
jgi:hypothetical protein